MHARIRHPYVILVVVLVALFLLQGCVSTSKVLNGWIGQTGSQFIAGAGLGPPDDVRSDGRDGHILVWGGQPNATTQIYVDGNDVIYYWRTWSPGTVWYYYE